MCERLHDKLLLKEIGEASHAKVTQAAAFKHKSLLPYSHSFGLNTFCCSMAATCVF